MKPWIDHLKIAAATEHRSLGVYALKARWVWRLVILGFAAAGAVFGIASPFFQKLFVDRLLAPEATANAAVGATALIQVRLQLHPLIAIGLAFVCSLVAQIFSQCGNFLAVREGAVLQRLFSEHLYQKMLSIRTASLGSTTIGEVVSLYATDVPGATALVDQVLPMAAMIACNLILAPLAVQWICGIPALRTAAVIGVLILFILTLSKRQSRFFGLFKQLAAERTGIVNEWVQNIRLLRILGWVNSFELKIFTKREEETQNRIAMVTNGQFMNAVGSSMNFALNLGAVALLMFFSRERVTPGQLLALLWIFGVFLSRPLRQIPWFFTFTFDSLTSLRRLEKFLERPADAEWIDGNESAPATSETGCSVRVRGLNLYSQSGDRQGVALLKDINFDIAPGEFVAIVGEVGSGKSLLALSLLGETSATFESFEIGGQNILPMRLAERRRFFSFVSQEGFVMTASLRENVVFEYEPEIKDQVGFNHKVEESLESAQFQVRSELRGAGLEIELGERGVNLSGGQRQRVALARAHFLKRPIILLDDCLSAVDVDTEAQLVSKLLSGAWKSQTRLLVTHRLSVLSQVQRIFFIEKGQIVETGHFDELIARSDRMREFVASVQRSSVESDLPARSAGTDTTSERSSSADIDSVAHAVAFADGTDKSKELS